MCIVVYNTIQKQTLFEWYGMNYKLYTNTTEIE